MRRANLEDAATLARKHIALFMTLMLCLTAGCGDASHSQDTAVEPRQIRQAAVSSEVLDCDSSNSTVRQLCEVILQRVNSELDAAGIDIDRNGILYTLNDPTKRKVPTGHSCTVTAQIQHVHARARLLSSAQLDLSGNGLNKPLILRLTLPAELHARIDVKQRFGFRAFFGCSNYAQDSYSLAGDLGTTANLIVAFTLNPRIVTNDLGDYAVTLWPEVGVAVDLMDTQPQFRVRGVSPITPVWTFVAGFTSTLARAGEAFLLGDSVGEVFGSTLGTDVGLAIVLGASKLPGSAEDVLWDMAYRKFGEPKLNQGANKLRENLQESLNAKVRRALNTDADGKRVFVVKSDFVQRLQRSGNLADIEAFVPPIPADCGDELMRMCSSCRGCQACVERAMACHDMKAAAEELNPGGSVRPPFERPTRSGSSGNSGAPTNGTECDGSEAWEDCAGGCGEMECVGGRYICVEYADDECF